MADPSYIVDGVLTDGEAWVALAKTTLGSDTASVTFTSTDDGQVGDWSQYMDLVMISYGRTTGVGSTDRELNMQLNADTGSNYHAQSVRSYSTGITGQWTSSPAVRFEIGQNTSSNAGANTFAVTVTELFDINSGKYKSMLLQFADDHDGSGYVGMIASTYKSQAPITEIDLVDHNGGILIAGSRYDLFGVLPRMVA